MFKTAGFALLICFLLMEIAVVADTPQPDAAAASSSAGFVTVNGVAVSRDEFTARLERVPVQTSRAGRTVTLPAGQYVVEELITRALIMQLAEKEHVTPTDEQVDRRIKNLIKGSGNGNFQDRLRQMGTTAQEWRDQIMIQQAVINLLARDTKVTDAEIRAKYDAELKLTPSQFVRPSACRISVIIAKAKPRIDKAYKLLQRGEAFGSVALQMSEDKTTAPYQGVVGWLSMDMSVVPKVIRTTAFSLEVGRYSKPFFVQDKSDKAWVILKVDQKRARVQESLDDVKDMIREQIALEKADRKAFDKTLRDFIVGSSIDVNDERYKAIPEMVKHDGSLGERLAQPATPAK